LPGMSGMELQKRLVQDGISLPIIMITGYADIPSAVQAMRNGALTFLEKPCSDQKLWESISQALDLEAASRFQRQQRTDIVCRLKTLSGDEHCVLDMLLAGKPNKIIARDLEMGLRTVELRRAKILEKMHASSLAELVQMAMLVKLIVAMAQEPSAERFALPNEIEATIRSLPDDPIQGMQTAGLLNSPRSEADGS
jgi:two-component system, LuxR family, response regulator FixJ